MVEQLTVFPRSTPRELTAVEVITAIESRGGRLWVEGNHVRFRVPSGRAVSISIIKAMKTHEQELLARLRERE